LSGGERLPHFPDKLLVGLVDAEHWAFLVIGALADLQNILHALDVFRGRRGIHHCLV